MRYPILKGCYNSKVGLKKLLTVHGLAACSAKSENKHMFIVIRLQITT